MAALAKIPEVILFNHIEQGLKFLRVDFDEQASEEDTFLARIFSGIVIDKRYNVLEQAKKIFIENDEKEQRFVEVHFMFNAHRSNLPTIHVTLPAEQTQSGGNGMGMDQGYMEPIVSTETITGVFTRRSQTTIGIVITSDNPNEVIAIYYTLKALLIALMPSLHLAGLENAILSGGDVQLGNFFSKAMNVNCQYETSVPNIFSSPIIRSLTAKGTPVNS